MHETCLPPHLLYLLMMEGLKLQASLGRMQGLKVSSSSMQEMQVTAGCVALWIFCFLSNHFYHAEDSTLGWGANREFVWGC